MCSGLHLSKCVINSCFPNGHYTLIGEVNGLVRKYLKNRSCYLVERHFRLEYYVYVVVIESGCDIHRDRDSVCTKTRCKTSETNEIVDGRARGIALENVSLILI